MTDWSPILDGVDEVFKALADPTRRSLLDELFRTDGQTLTELEARLPMTRFGVMKHLKQLEEAGLVVTRRRGREKLHFLNPVPIRLVHDRWVSKYAEPWAAGLSGLKQELERQMEKVFEIYIKTTPERLWEAITDPDDPGQVQLRRRRVLRLDARRPHRAAGRAGRRPARRGRGARGRSAPPARAHADRELQPGSGGRGRPRG